MAAWLAYEALCRSPLGKHEEALALIGYVFLVALTYGFTHVFSGRGAFTQIGALIGTIMVANVFVIIIPYQKKTIAALIAGTPPDPAWGAAGKQRSVHNNYLTLPVVFLMLSNHYPLFFATRFNWLIVAIVLAIGPVIRHFFNSRHAGKGSPWWTWGVAAAGIDRDRLAVGRRSVGRQDRRAAGNAEIRRGAGHRDFPLQHVPRGRAGMGGLHHRAEGRAARRCRRDQAARVADRHQCRTLARHAAWQCHRDHERRAAGAGGLDRCRRTDAIAGLGEVVSPESDYTRELLAAIPHPPL